MNSDILFFFDEHTDALPLYEKLEAEIFAQIPDVKVKAQKTQITFGGRYGFAFVSFLPMCKAKDRPDTFITVTFGQAFRVESPRIDAATEPYPNRWTHHVTVSSVEEIDEELMGWIVDAAAFAASKGRRK